jgi:hypothetical protein
MKSCLLIKRRNFRPSGFLRRKAAIRVRDVITLFCHLVSVNRLMLFNEIFAINYQNHKEHKNILSERNAEF